MLEATPTISSPQWEKIYNERLDRIQRQIAKEIRIDFADNPFRGLDRRFVIAHAPRVGSHLLCEGLISHGAVVEEYFEVPRIHAVCRKRGFTTLQAYCEWLIGRVAVNGVFGVSGGVKALAPLTLAGEIPGFIADWRFVHLTRTDFVARAVSELIAMQTGAYKSSKTPSRQVTDEDYDAVRLRNLIDATLTVNAAWEGAFKTHGVEPLRLTYESLCDDPPAVVALAARHLGLDGGPIREERFLAPKLEKQATSLNERWSARFRAENEAFCQARESGVFEPQNVQVLRG